MQMAEKLPVIDQRDEDPIESEALLARLGLASKVATRHLDFFYGDNQALFDNNLDIAEHRVTAIIGPSGCGKSTQAKLIADKYHLGHLYVGGLIRRHIKKKTALGLKIKKYVDKGSWVPTSLVLKILRPELGKINYQDFIIDGFPRYLKQAPQIQKILSQKNQNISLLIHLSVTLKEIRRRRQLKMSQGDSFQDLSRSDQTILATVNRHKSYQKTIRPILRFFKDQHLLSNIDGNRPVKPIFQDISSQIDKLIINQKNTNAARQTRSN